MRAIPFALLLIGAHIGLTGEQHWPTNAGIAYAVASGAIASGIGYSLWYLALRHISLIEGAVAQLSVPTITAVAGLFLLDEVLTTRLVAATIITLGGIALVIVSQRKRTSENQ